MTQLAIKIAAFFVGLTSAGAAFPQNLAVPLPANIVQLSAAATVEVQQDFLVLTLSTTREGADAAAVQSQLKTALDGALSEVKKTAQPGLMEVRTGGFNLNPRLGNEGKLRGWQGSTELVLEGRDFSRITAAAAKVQSLTIGNIAFGLSREERAKAEAETQLQAIDSFKSKAMSVSKAFGFSSYTLREISVSANDRGPVPMRSRAMEVKSSFSSAPVAIEAGKTAVTVDVSGSVQLK